jgi:HPt (histidine-containing phosphotransfer) domain-containing protein
MPKPAHPAPKVATFADHEVIQPHHALAEAVRVTGKESGPDLEAIARAEAALAELSGEFAGWMRAECDRLDAARHRLKTSGLTGGTRDELFRAAHDIKGQAATFGYPIAAVAADSLCRLLEHTPDQQRIPLALIDQHVDGVRAIIREGAQDSAHSIAKALASSLRLVSDEFLLTENRGRPGYLDGIVSPPLVPRG